MFSNQAARAEVEQARADDLPPLERSEGTWMTIYRGSRCIKLSACL